MVSERNDLQSNGTDPKKGLNYPTRRSCSNRSRFTVFAQVLQISGIFMVDQSELFAVIMNNNSRIVSSGAGHSALLQDIHVYG